MDLGEGDRVQDHGAVQKFKYDICSIKMNASMRYGQFLLASNMNL